MGGDNQRSGNDPRGRLQNSGAYQQNRYENQQGPLANATAYNYGRGSEADWGNYNDIMNQYRQIATGQSGTPGGGGGGGGFSAAGKYSPFTVSYTDPFKSYGGFTNFSETGGYSAEDMQNLRARAASPIRASYANAERELQRQRSLQGGYAPNAIATLAKMAREQGQATSDAVQSIEGGIVDQRNRNMLSGLTGMSGIEGQRLDAQLQAGMFNAQQRAQAQAANLSAAERASASRSAASAASDANRMEALQGMRLLYGTTPGMSATFGNQAINTVGQGGEFGLNLMGRETQAQQLPGRYDQTQRYINDAANMAYPWLDYLERRNQGGGGYRTTQPYIIPGDNYPGAYE